MSYFMLFLTILFTVGSLLAKRGWHREPRWKNKPFIWGVGMMAVAVLLLLLIMVLGMAILGIKIFVAFVLGFLVFLWSLKWVLVLVGVIVFVLWLKGKFSQRGEK